MKKALFVADEKRDKHAPQTGVLVSLKYVWAQPRCVHS